ncbi:DDE-type integrase/transposase/recombinase [Nesterenkonia lacusekhoensis]|uniref:DDE-type integrase/transposase/recombinase n=1 Tax=Nesterenkonia lacusekhoensis TaxID=150832 RepID=UPI001AE6F4B9
MSRRTAWKLCSQAGILSSAQRRRRGKGKKAGPPVFDDHVQRVFRADAPNRLWLTDITEHRTSEGKLYCCAIKDVHSNRIVGYSISDRMTAKLAVDAVRNAVTRRGDVAGCILHADRGSQAVFNWSSQQCVVGLSVVDRRTPRRECATPRSRVAGCSWRWR